MSRRRPLAPGLRAGWLSALLLLAATGASAQTTGSLDPEQAGGPIEILSEQGMEWRRNENVFIARGQARAIQGGTTLTADELRAHYREEKDGETRVWRIEAVGQVGVTSERGKLRGDRAVYNLETGAMTLTGRDLSAETKEFRMTARESMVYDLETSRAVALGDAHLYQEGRELRADRLVAILGRKQEGKTVAVDRVEAEGGVIIRSDQGVVEADKGQYDMTRKVASFDGRVTLRQGKNVITGCGGEVNVQSGVSTLSSCPGADGRVRGILFPQTRKKAPGN